MHRECPRENMFLIVTRMRDTAFKRVIETMPIGLQVKSEGPVGNLVLHHDRARDAAFLAGGVGITSFCSILLRATRESLPPRPVLAYSNRRPEDASCIERTPCLAPSQP